jgi:sterol O-acyltransferase
VQDFFLFSMSPSLVYDCNFPRTSQIRIGYLAEKSFLAAGLVTCGAFLLSRYLLPVLSNVNTIDAFDAILQLLIPVTCIFLIVFFIVFEWSVVRAQHALCFARCPELWLISLTLVDWVVVILCSICNAFAELSYFGDRSFYDKFWCATTFMEF